MVYLSFTDFECFSAMPSALCAMPVPGQRPALFKLTHYLSRRRFPIGTGVRRGSAVHPIASKAHVTDQLAYLRRHLWPSPAGSRFPAPIGSEPCAVPTDHGIRLDDRQRAPNIGEQPIEADQYQSVDAAEEKPLWRGPPQDIDLLAQYQDLRLKLCSRSEQVDDHPPDQSAKVPHQATTSPDSRSSASRMRFATGTPFIRRNPLRRPAGARDSLRGNTAACSWNFAPIRHA